MTIRIEVYSRTAMLAFLGKLDFVIAQGGYETGAWFALPHFLPFGEPPMRGSRTPIAAVQYTYQIRK